MGFSKRKICPHFNICSSHQVIEPETSEIKSLFPFLGLISEQRACLSSPVKKLSSLFSCYNFLSSNKIKFRMARPTFFKVLIGDFSKQLRIPPAFIENFNGRSLEKCVVKSPTGGYWSINVEEIGKSLYFGSGWQDFVKDHCLEAGDFMVFKYCGKSKFKVKIYDKTCCEKIMNLHSKNGIGNENETRPITLRCKRGFRRSEIKPVILEEVSNATRRSFLSFKSENSYFISPWTNNRKHCVTIPKQLAREKKLLRERIVEIMDPAGKTWAVELSRSRVGGHLNMKGWMWSNFWRGNEIEIGDTLIFEFTMPTAVQVHIFRGLGLGLGEGTSTDSKERRNRTVFRNATVKKFEVE